jgi:NADH:ubiquinone oxidoreductase subunit E
MLTVTVCVGSSCYMRGSDELAGVLEALIEKASLNQRVQLIGSFCMGECSTGISVKLGDQSYRDVRLEEAENFFYKELLPWAHQGESERCNNPG